MRVATQGIISLDEVDSVFNGGIIVELASALKPTKDADISRFAKDVRTGVRRFIHARTRGSPNEICKSIEHLYRLNARAERGSDQAAHELADAIANMSPEVQEWLLHCTPLARNMPAPGLFKSTASRQQAVEQLRIILSYGGKAVRDRKRPTGKRSQSFKPLLYLPTTGRGKPKDQAAREFVEWLALIYVETTGKCTPKTANNNVDIRGPFSKFAHRCFELAGAKSGNLTRLINERGVVVRKMPSGTRVTSALLSNLCAIFECECCNLERTVSAVTGKDVIVMKAEHERIGKIREALGIWKTSESLVEAATSAMAQYKKKR
jgi:hypothetical protein